MNRPNIIYLHSHDTGRYIQPYGHAIPTPNLQTLAEDGVLFRKAFTAAPTCSPSRACLLTGQCAHQNGMLGLSHRGFFLTDYNHHLIHTLHKIGYTSALSGVQHVASGQPERIGYKHLLNESNRQRKGSGQDAVTDAAIEFIENPPDQPFFLTIGFNVTHRDFPDPGPDEDERYCLPPAPFPDTPETRRDIAAFKASARILDNNMGAIINAVDRSGLRDNTLIICTTDHGIAFPGMKCHLTDHGMGIMLIMRGPHGFTGGKVVDAMISQIDIFPTLCDLLQIDPPDWLEGKSFLPVVTGNSQEINHEIFGEVTYHAAYDPQRAVRTTRYKYIRRFDGRQTPVLPNCDDGLTKEVWLTHDWQKHPIAEERLYDLIFDPNETNNLAYAPEHAPTLKEMQTRLQNWMTRTNDPLLNGPVPMPKGGRYNDPDGLSPRDKPNIAP